MTRTAFAPARTRRFSRAALVAGLLALSVVAPVGAQSPAPTPELTFAPLVTLPPIVAPANPTPTDLADGYSLGRADAPVQIEVWEDFQCPFCRRWTEQIKPALITELIEPGFARLTYRPLAFLGEESRWAAVAADLAMEQGRFWPMHDQLYANQLGENIGTFSLDRILSMAAAAGLDMDAFREGLVLDAARERYARLEAASAIDAIRLGVNATPTIVVNGVRLESPDLDTIRAAVRDAIIPSSATPVGSPAADPTEPAASPAS
jgi:protein-disulfide isomerase